MKIIHCAPFNIMTKTGGALYANPIKISSGLIQNDHFVHNFDYRDSARYFSIFKNKKNGRSKMNTHLKQIINEIDPDIVIFGHAELIDIDTYEYIQSKNIKMIYWYNDLPYPQNINKIEKYFDAIFTTAYSDKYHFLPNLVDKNVEKYISYENKIYKSDLLFTGRATDERLHLIDYIKNNIQCKQRFLGDTKQSVVIGDEYLRAIADSKIALNHNRDFTLGYKWYSSDRLVHILANGCFCLSTFIVDGEDFFEDKLEYYKDHEELKYKVEYFLQNDKERIEKSKWLHNRVHELFNAKRVGKYILDIIDQNNKELKQYEWVK
jgi:hypothetical protein